MPAHHPQYLIIQTAFIGDVVLSLPVAQLLKSEYPDSTISLLVRKGNENLLENHPAVDTIYLWNKQNHKYRSLYNIYRELRKFPWQGIINLHRFFSTGLLSSLLSAKNKVGFDKNPLSFTYDDSVPHELPYEKDGQTLHEVNRNLELLSSFGIQGFDRPRLFPSEDDYKVVSDYVSNPYYVLAPSSVWSTKQWPVQKWKDLVAQINENVDILLIGGKNDRSYCQEIAGTKPTCYNLAGDLTFLQSAALIDNALVSVVNDSAPLHFSSAMNTPTVAIFCSTIPEFGFYPLADRSRIIQFQGDLYCRPCGVHGYNSCPEGHFKCAEDIAVETVFTAIEELTEKA